MKINSEGLEEVSRGLNQECLETVAFIMCTDAEDKLGEIEKVLLNYNVLEEGS